LISLKESKKEKKPKAENKSKNRLFYYKIILNLKKSALKMTHKKLIGHQILSKLQIVQLQLNKNNKKKCNKWSEIEYQHKIPEIEKK
jgi:hypothetical protein